MPSTGQDNQRRTTSATATNKASRTAFYLARFKSRLRSFTRWWLTPHRPYQPLFVIATWRSGSNLLLSYLRQQPNVAMLSEVLCPRLPVGPWRDHLPPRQALQHIRHCLQSQRAPLRGCKLMLHQLSNCGLSLDDLNVQFPTAKYILLYRQLLAEQFVSHQVAQVTDQYLVREGETRRHAEINIDPNELRAYCDDMRRRYRDALACQWLDGRAVLLSYEELVADPASWMQQHICPLLGVPFRDLHAQLVKQNNRPLANQIVNYRDVAALLNSPLCRQQHHWPRRTSSRSAA